MAATYLGLDKTDIFHGFNKLFAKGAPVEEDTIKTIYPQRYVHSGKSDRIGLLISGLVDEHGEVHRPTANVIKGVAIHHTIEVIEELSSLLNSPSPRLRRAAVIVLSEIEPTLSVFPIIKALEDKDPYVCQAAITELIKFGETAIDPLIRCLTRTRQENVRRYGAYIFGHLRIHRTIPCLIDIIHSSNEQTKFVASWSLAQFKNEAAAKAILKEMRKVRTSLLLKKHLISLLGDIGIETITDEIIDFLNDPDLKGHVISTLGKLRNPKVVPALRKLATNGASWIQPVAIQALSKIGTDNAMESIVGLLEKSSGEALLKAIEAAPKIRRKAHLKRAIPRLANILLHTSNPAIKKQALRSLEEISTRYDIRQYLS